DRIAAVGARLSRPPADGDVDVSGFLVVPGLVNTHTHGHNNLLRGLAGRWTLEDLLSHGPALNANRTVEDHYVSAAIGAIELLKLRAETMRRLDGAGNGRIRVALAPTIPTQCTDEFLEGCARLAREHGVGVHTHLSESKIQAITAQRRWGKTAVARLEDVGL